MGIYQVFYVKPTLGIFTEPQHGMQRLNIFAMKSFLQKLVGPKDLTSLTVKCTTIGKTKYLGASRFNFTPARVDFSTGPKFGIHICLSVPNNWRGGGGGGGERGTEDEKNTCFVVLVRVENKRRILPHANKNILFLGPSPYDFTTAWLYFCNWGTLHGKLLHLIHNVWTAETRSATLPYVLL